MTDRDYTAVATSKTTVATLINQMKPAFQSALGTPAMAERFARVALTLVRSNPMLESCDATTLMGGLMQAAQLNLDFTLGGAYLIPYWSNKRNCREAQFQIGYKGYIDLFYRHPLAQELYAEVVYANDRFLITKGTNRSILHEPVLNGEKGNAIGFYAVARLKSGAFNFAYMSKSEMDAHRNHYSKQEKTGRSVWDSEYNEMALKTVIKKVLKWMPKSVEFQMAMDVDEGIKRPINMKEVENINDVPTYFPDVNETEPIPIPEKVAPPKAKKAKEEIVQKIPDVVQSTSTNTAQPNADKQKKDEVIDLIMNTNAPEPEKDEFIVAVRDAEYPADVQRIETQWRLLHVEG
jgi:recombination protein RecT